MRNFEKFLINHNINFLQNHEIAPFTSFKLGGEVDYIVFPSEPKQLQILMCAVKEYQLTNFVLGNGSNVLFRDKPSVQVVICMQDMQSFLYARNNRVFVSANVNLFAFNKFLKDNNLAGFEFSFGIPGTIGGSIKGNAGAFGDCVCEHLKSVTVLNIDTCEFEHLTKRDIKYSYRKTNIKGIIVEAEFKFQQGSFEEISKLQNEFLEKRKETQPYSANSAGSIFKRGKEYIPAKLIDELGLKGNTIGGAQISQKHAGFIVKKDNTCTSADVINLIKFIKKEVKKAYKINLKEEIIII